MGRVLSLAAAALLLAGCNLEQSVGGLVRDAEEAGITLDVTECGVDEAGVAFARVTATSAKEEWGTVLFNVDMLNEEGVVIGQGSTSFRNVQPGRKYETRVVISFPSQEPPPSPRCEARLDFASRN
jgi:hypothetical protein